jgi:multidrug efflux pump subunit AcrA (membrane-fusion protein)
VIRAILWLPALSILATACGNKGGDATTAAAEPAAASASRAVSTPWAPVRAPKDLSLLEGPAKILVSPESSAAISTPFSAKVLRIHVAPGQHVDKGDAIVDVLCPEVVRASGSEHAASLRLEAYQKRKAQLEALRADGLVRLGDVADVDAKIAEAKGELSIAGATLRSATAFGAKLAGDTLTLTSPVAGTVTDLSAVVGEAREPSQGPIANVAGTGPMRIEAHFTVRPPEGATYTFHAPPDLSSALHVVGVAPTLDADGSLRAWFETDQALPIPAGALGKVRVELPDAKGVVAVPASAVGLADGKAFVVLERTGKPEPVVVLATSGADALVRGALEPTDRVAADANLARTESTP